MSLRYQTQIPNSESDQGVDNYDYGALLRLVRARAGFVIQNSELDALQNQINAINATSLITLTDPEEVLT